MPASLLFVESWTPVATPVRPTLALGTAAPEPSSTVPLTVPRLVCASARQAQVAYATASLHEMAVIFACLRPPAAKSSW